MIIDRHRTPLSPITIFTITIGPLLMDCSSHEFTIGRFVCGQVAEKAISAIRHLQSDLDDIQCKTGLALGVSWTWRVEEAKMHWALGDQETAMHLLKLLNTQLGKVSSPGPGSSKPDWPNCRLSRNLPASLFLNMRRILYRNTGNTMSKTR